MSDADILSSFVNSPQTIAPDAETAQIVPSSDSDILQQFVGPETEMKAKYGTPGQQAIAGLEGVARGATLGGSDVLERATGLSTPAAMRGRMQANPVTSTGGTMLGGAGLTYLTGGVAAPAEAGLAGSLIASSVEGALFGAGNAISDAALGNPDLNAQKIISDIGMGATLGVGVGALAHGVGAAFGKFGNLKGSVSEAIAKEGESANRAEATVIALRRETPVSSPEKVSAAADQLGLPDISQPNGVTKNLKDFLQSDSPTLVSALESRELSNAHAGLVDTLGEIAPETNLTKAQVGGVVSDGITQQIRDSYEPIEQQYNAIKETTKDIPVSEKSMKSVANNIRNIPEISESASSTGEAMANRAADKIENFTTLDQIKNFRSSFRRSLSPTASPEDRYIAGVISEKLEAMEEANQDRYVSKQNEIYNGLDDEGQKAGLKPYVDKLNALTEQKNAAKDAYRPFIENVKTLAKQLGKKNISGASGAIDFIEGLTPEAITQKLFSKNNSQFLSFFEDKFPEQMAILREYQKGLIREAATDEGGLNPTKFFKAIDKLEPEVQRAVFLPDEMKKLGLARDYATGFPSKFKPANASFGAAIRHLAHHPIEGGLANAVDLGAYGILKAASLGDLLSRPGAQEELGNISQKYTAITAANNIAKKASDAISQNINGILRGGAMSGATHLLNMGYDAKIDRIKELAQNPQALQAHISNHIDGISQTLPGISQGVSTSIARSVNFLNSKIPRQKNELPLSPKWTPSDAQIQKFDRYYDVVNNPIGVLKNVKDATLTSYDMEALQATHPDLLQEMQKELLTQANPETAKKMPYARKQSISMFLGTPLDETMLPAVRQANQMALSNPAPKPSEVAMQGKPTLGGMKEMKLSNRSSTLTNRQESMGE